MIPDEPRTDALQTDPTFPVVPPARDLPLNLAPVRRFSPLWNRLSNLRKAQRLAVNSARNATALYVIVVLPVTVLAMLPTFVVDIMVERHFEPWRDAPLLGYLAAGAVIVGAAALACLLVWLFRLFLPTATMPETVERQIADIVIYYPAEVASWGGEWVLRVPKCVDKLLDLEDWEATP
jgi:hypothetical protein